MEEASHARFSAQRNVFDPHPSLLTVAVQGGLRAALRDSRRRLAARRRRRLLAGSVLVLVLLLGAGALVQALLAAPAAPDVPRQVNATDTDQDGLADAVENTLGSDPLDRTPRHRLPESWVQRHGLSLADAELADRPAPYPRPPQSPPVYGAQGLPPELRMTYHDVYAYGRPAAWDETRDGPWDSRLDPARWDVNGSGVPYAWLIHHGLDPFDVQALDLPDPTRNVTWTPREAYQRGLHPRSPDGDADGLRDEEEERLGTSPRKYSTTGTGIADGWLHASGFSLTDPTPAYQDPDRDGLTNLQEFEASLRLVGPRALRGEGLDPRKQSTVDGPIPDGWLARYGLDALDRGVAQRVTQEETFTGPNGTYTLRLRVLDEYLVARPPTWNESLNGPWMGGSDPTKPDTDADGLTDLQELVGWDTKRPSGPKRVFSDPTKADTDADGLTDVQEREGRAGAITFASTDPSAPDSDFDGLLDGEELGMIPWMGVKLPLLDPNAEDSDADGLRDGEEALYWKDRHEGYLLQGRGYEWGPESRPLPGVALARPGVTPQAALDALRPGGDVDGDGIPNILDGDADNDALLDGWEVKPGLYRTVSTYASERARPATDPANVDTDLDTLPDQWELSHGLYDERLGGWNLDPSKWSSFPGATSDADRDLDDDSATWYSYSGRSATANLFRATNKVEHQAGSHPNKAATSIDGIPDGWKIFWGSVYPLLGPTEIGDVYPGAPDEFRLPPGRPLPKINSDDDVPFAAFALRRVVVVDGQTFRETMCPQAPVTALNPTRGTLRVCVLQHDVQYTYRSAAQNLTNPFLDDTDGDLMPDACEAAWRPYGTGNARLNPVAADATADPDEDGLANLGECLSGGNPYLPDSDFGGANDRAEAAVGLNLADPADDGRALDNSIDTDRDGLADTVELTGFPDSRGVRVTTSPADPDTDGDGLLDGFSLSTILNRRFHRDVPEDMAILTPFLQQGLVLRNYLNGEVDVVGELDVRTDPNLFSTAGDGVPDGYATQHVSVVRNQPTGLFDIYSYGRPSWWKEPEHGLWRSGLTPGTAITRDLDDDGLDDLNGEDPYPAVNPTNRLPRGDPREEGITPLERLLRAQAYGGDPLPDDVEKRTRFDVTLTLDPLPGNVTATGTTPFSGNATLKGVEGRVPVRNLTVLLALEDRGTIIGVAVTDATGAFRGNVTVAPSLAAPETSAGVPVFGDVSGRGVHKNEGPALNKANTSRAVDVFAWSYNETWYAPLPSQARGFVLDGEALGGARGAETARQRVNLTLTTSLSLDARAVSPLGDAVPVNATLLDALGRPVRGERVTILPENVTLPTGPDGRVSVNVTLPRVPGFHVLNASFAGTTYLLPSAAETRVRLTEATRIDVSPPPSKPRPNESFLVAGRLSTASGAAVAGAAVTVDAGGARAPAVTDRFGGFQALLALPADAPLGIASLQAFFAGNDTLEGSRAVVPLAIEGAPRLDASSLRLPLNGRGQVVARLADATGRPLADASVELLGLGVPVRNRTDDEGNVRLDVDATGLTPGERPLVVRFRDDVLGEATASVSLTTTSTTRLTLHAGPLLRGETANLTGRLVDALGSPLVRQPIEVRLGPFGARVVTDARGDWRASFPLGETPRPGRVQVAAAYAGTADGVYAPGANETAALVRDSPTLVLSDVSVVATRPTIEGRLVTLVGEPLVNRQVRVRTAGGDSPVLTDDRGAFRAFLTLAPQQPLGPFDARFSMEGEDLLQALDATVRFTLKDQGVLRLEMPESAPLGGSVRVPFRVLDSQSRPVPDARLTLTLDGEPLEADSSGGALSFAVPPRVKPGPHTVTVRVVSDVVTAPALSKEMDVRRPSTMRLQEARPIVPGEPGEIVVALSSAGSPLPNESVLVHGAGVPLVVATDENGVARIPVPAGRATSSTYHVAYLGQGENGASSLVVTVGTATAPGPVAGLGWGWLLLALVLLVVLAAAVVARRRRASPVADVLRKAARRLRSNRQDVRALYDAYLGLLQLAGLDEESGETLTFGGLLARFVERDSAVEAELALLTELFNRAVYAPDMLDVESVDRATLALEDVARHVRTGAAGAAPVAGPMG